MDTIDFSDLLHIRKGDDLLTMGWGPSRVETLTGPDDWQVKAAALREIFRQTLGEQPDLACPLDPRITAEADRGDVVQRTVEYAAGPDERLSAYVLLPKPLGPSRPGVVCIHPTTELGKEQSVGNDPSEGGQDRAYALHLARRGYVTLSYDLLGAGERCYPGLESFDTTPFYEQYPRWSVRGRDLWDYGRAVDLLQDMQEVDPDRIGSIGHSQGGGITIHGMALDDRVKAGVSSCGLWPTRLSKNPFNHARTAWWVGRPFLRPYCIAAKPFPIDMHECLALIAPRAILCITALNDHQFGIEEAPELRPSFENMADNVGTVFRLTNAADNFCSLLHEEGHGFAEEQRDAAYTFLDQHLQPDKEQA